MRTKFCIKYELNDSGFFTPIEVQWDFARGKKYPKLDMEWRSLTYCGETNTDLIWSQWRRWESWPGPPPPSSAGAPGEISGWRAWGGPGREIWNLRNTIRFRFVTVAKKKDFSFDLFFFLFPLWSLIRRNVNVNSSIFSKMFTERGNIQTGWHHSVKVTVA